MELMAAETFNGKIDRHFGSALCEIGFEKIKENKWVKDLETGIRKVVTMMHWKGAVSTPRWGYSLDYVPHFDNSYKNIYWHRTNKSAMIDVFPIYFDFFKYSFSRFSTPDEHSKKLKELMPEIIYDINEFYSSGCEMQDLVSILEKCHSSRSSGLDFWNWTQLPLAYAFVLNKSGESEKAKIILDKFVDRENIAVNAKQKLIDRFNSVCV